MILAEAKGVPIVSEDFLSACEKAGKVVRPDAHMLNSASSASAASSAKQPPARKRAAPAPAAPAAAPQKVAARWYWADDSATGHQDKWVEYDAARTAMLEKAFAAKQARVNVDTERFVQASDSPPHTPPALARAGWCVGVGVGGEVGAVGAL